MIPQFISDYYRRSAVCFSCYWKQVDDCFDDVVVVVVVRHRFHFSQHWRGEETDRVDCFFIFIIYINNSYDHATTYDHNL